jgi:serine/threonine-protein kinase
MSLDIGSRIGDYEIVAVLGAGGMGKVFKVRNAISDRVEAMKILLPDLEHEPDLADRFMREIKVQASLQHPNIAALHTALRVENQLLMVMELVEGMTLEQRLHQGPIPLDQGVDCICQVLDALGYAHQRGVVHRDIKPANMMLTPSGLVKLMDFGIAKAAADRKLTMTGTTMGSLYYMSPEQIKGVSTIDSRSDLYSVGVSLYEIVTGKKPFDGDSQFAIMAAHLEKNPVPPITLDSRLPSILNDAILMSIAKNPDERFQSAQAFGAALGAVRQSLGMAPMSVPSSSRQVNPEASTQGATVLMTPVPGRLPTALPPPQPPPPAAAEVHAKSGKRWLWVSAGALATVLVLVAAIQFGPWRKTSAQSPEGVQSSAPASAPVTQPTAQPPIETAQPPQAPAATQAPVERFAPATPAPAPVSRPARGEQKPPMRQAAQPPAASSTVQPPSASVIRQALPATPEPERSGHLAQQPPPQAAVAPPRAAAAPTVDDAAVLQDLREQLMQLASRVGAVQNSLANLKRSQAAAGMSLRGDMSSAESRMNYLMDGAKSALSAHDATATKKFMQSTEREVEKLEKFLGL